MATLRNARTGLGRKPALLIIDANVGFTDPAFPPGAECGAEIAVIKKLISAFRRYDLPVVYTRHSYAHPSEAPEAHESNLRDLDLMYGDVVSCDEFMTMLARDMQGGRAAANHAQKSTA